MSKLSLRNSLGEVLDIAEQDESGCAALFNTIEHPLVPKLLEFLMGTDFTKLELLVDGKCSTVPRATYDGVVSAIRSVVADIP